MDCRGLRFDHCTGALGRRQRLSLSLSTKKKTASADGAHDLLILLACAAALYLGSREGFDAVIPEVPEESLPAIFFHGHCMERSDQIYQNEIAIHRKTEKIVGYGRFRDDIHGKGLTRITTERLEREEQCKQS